MQVRCPQCHTPIEIDSDGKLSDIACPSCGSSFSLLGTAETTPYETGTTTIGHFDLVEQIGVGTFGFVWKARDTELDRTVALKIPRKGQLDPDETEQFLREARAAAQLRHPNIVSVHEVGRDQDTVFIVSDFVQGVTLADRLTGQRFSVREAAELCAKIADALHHAHEQGVIHRDLKPGNIILDVKGEPHIMDFGLARREAGEVTMTVEGRVLGTPAYMSPEQAKGAAHAADRRSDVYSLGVILFEMLTAERPFRGNVRMLVHQVINDDPPIPRRLNGSVPWDLETICLKCLEKEPGKRYGTAHALTCDLRHWLAGESIAARPISRTARAWRWCKRNRAITALAIAVATVLLLGVAISSYFALEGGKQAQLTRQAHAELQRRSYALLMVAAFQAWDTANPEGAKELLNKAREEDSPSAPPDIAWRFLWQRCQEGLPRTLNIDGRTHCVAYAPDGSGLAVGLTDGKVVLHNFTSGETIPLAIPPQADALWGSVECLVFSPDGSRLLAGGVRRDATGLLCLWELPTGRSALLPVEHAGYVLDLAVSPDGSLAASVSADDMTAVPASQAQTSLKLWSVPEGTVLWERHLPARLGLAQLAFLWRPEPMLVCTGAGKLQFWDIRSGNEVFSAPANSDSGLLGFAVSPDGQSIVTADAGVREFDVTSRGPERRGRYTWRRCDAVRFSPDGKLVAARDRDSSKIIIWFRDSGHELARLSGGYETPSDLGVADLIFSPDGNQIVLGRDAVKIWDLRPWFARRLLRGKGISDVLASPDRQSIVVAGYEQGVAGASRLVLSADCTREYLGVMAAYSMDRRRYVTETDDQLFHLWDMATARKMMTLPEQCRRPISLSLDARFVATNGAASMISVWDSASGKLIACRRYTGRLDDRARLSPGDVHGGPQSLALSPQGDRLVSAINVESNKVEVELWGLHGGVHPLGSYDAQFVGVCFSPAGDRLLVVPAYPDVSHGVARVWDVSLPKPQVLAQFESPHRLMRACFSPDGQLLLLSGRAPGDLILYDITKQERRRLNRSAGAWVYGLELSADERTLVTASLSGQIKFWRMPSGEELGTINLDEVLVLAKLAWDDEMLITGSHDGGVGFWQITPVDQLP